jgi:excisionase family DNA binding protein
MNMIQEPERWYSLKEIMEHLGVSRETILIWISKRGMPASKVGRLWKFKKTEVDEWIKSGGAAE